MGVMDRLGYTSGGVAPTGGTIVPAGGGTPAPTGSAPTGLPNIFSGGGDFNPLMIFAPRTYDRMQEAQQRKAAMEVLKRKYEFANKMADKLPDSSPWKDALRADPNNIDNYMTIQAQEANTRYSEGEQNKRTLFTQGEENKRLGITETGQNTRAQNTIEAEKAAKLLELQNNPDYQYRQLINQNIPKNIPPGTALRTDQAGPLQPMPQGMEGVSPTQLAVAKTVAPGVELTPSRIGELNAAYSKGGDEVAKVIKEFKDEDLAKKQKGLTSNIQEFIDSGGKVDENYMPLDPEAYKNFLFEFKRAGSRTGENIYDQTVGKYYGEQYTTTLKEMVDAHSNNNGLNYMTQQLDKGMYSGWGSQTVQTAKQLLVALGGDPAMAASGEAFNAESSRQMLALANGRLSTGVSNEDRMALTAQTANMGNTPAGNRLVIDFMRKLNDRKIEIGKQAIDYASKHDGRIDAGFDKQISDYAEAHPMFSTAGTVSSGSTGPDNATKWPDAPPIGTIALGHKYLGGNHRLTKNWELNLGGR